MIDLSDFINDYNVEKTCVYKGRKYFVRDNGAVYRRCLDDGGMRTGDEEWTIGKPNPHSGYCILAKRLFTGLFVLHFMGSLKETGISQTTLTRINGITDRRIFDG